MKNNSELLQHAEKIISPFVLSHIPEGTEPQALIDQWIHAIATDSQFFCNPNIASPIQLKNEVITLLQEHSIYTII